MTWKRLARTGGLKLTLSREKDKMPREQRHEKYLLEGGDDMDLIQDVH
jgi:hypothetical protein